MGLKDVLSKMKLVEVEAPGPAPGAPGAPARPSGAGAGAPPPHGPAASPAPAAKPLDVRELIGSLPAPQIDERALPHRGGGDALELPDFEAVYRAAGIAVPPHGYTAYKVLEILSSEGFAGLEPKARAAALAGFLKMNPSGPVPIGDVIQDAVRRDQALDKFEELLRGKLAAREREFEQENAALQAEIDQLAKKNRERMEANRKALAAEQERLAEWQTRKRIEERRLFDAVGPFVEQNPISTGTTGTAGAGSAGPPPGGTANDR